MISSSPPVGCRDYASVVMAYQSRETSQRRNGESHTRWRAAVAAPATGGERPTSQQPTAIGAAGSTEDYHRNTSTLAGDPRSSCFVMFEQRSAERFGEEKRRRLTELRSQPFHNWEEHTPGFHANTSPSLGGAVFEKHGIRGVCHVWRCADSPGGSGLSGNKGVGSLFWPGRHIRPTTGW